MTYGLSHRSNFLLEFKFYCLPLFIILHGIFEIADPSSMHGARHLGFEESGFLSHPCDILNITYFPDSHSEEKL